jgi:hypothetical protein
MDTSESRNSNKRPRQRDDAKRRGVEVAVERLICHCGLPVDEAQILSVGIYRLYRNLVTQKSLDDQIRGHRKSRHRAEEALAEKTAIASDREVPAYLADMREFAAHMIRLETLEKRNLGRGRAIEQASKATWDELRPQERRKARQYLADNVHQGDKTRRPAREVEYLRSVVGLIEKATGHRIRFSSSAPGSHPANRPRHHGVEFAVMTAAAEMADLQLSNEAMARRIHRIRHNNPQVCP